VSWNSVALGTLCNIYTGKKDVNEGNESGIYPFFTCATKHTFSDTFSFDCEAILVAGNGAVGQTNYFKGKFEAYQRTYVLCNFKGIIPHYLLYFLNGNLMYDLSFKVLGNTIPYIKKGMLTDFQIPLPPLPIQQKIVIKLDKIFAEIDNATAIAEINAKNAEALFQSYLRQVFEHEGKEWKRIKVKDLGRVQSGGTPSIPKKEYWGGDVEWFSSGELNDLYTLSSTRKITFEGIKNSNAKIFPANSLLIGMYDTAAMKMSLLSKPATFNQAIVGIEPTQKINMIFLYYALTFIKPYVLSLRRGVRQKNLSLAKIKELSIQFPKVDVQLRVSKRLDLFKGLSRKLSNVYLDKINQHIKIKNSILKQAFNGELFKAA